MKKIYKLLLILSCFVIKDSFSQLLNPGFESETGTSITDWTDNGSGTESVGTTNARTGSNALSYTTSNSSSNQDMRSNSSLSIPNNNYVHIIGWAIGNNANAQASVGTVMGSYNQSTNISTIGTVLTQLTFSGRNIQGSVQNAIVKLNSRSVSGSITIYWDDIVFYTSISSAVDLTNPNSASSVTTTSNTNGTIITVNWTDGTDANSGIREVLILRADGLSQTAPSLNDQGKYSVSGGSNGPNTVSGWTIVGIVNPGVQTFEDNSISPNNDYTYAVYMRDDAYNYSSPSTSSLTSFPVELSSFSAFANSNTVNLKWETKTEINNYGFEIERSQKSNIKSEAWGKIGFVNGHGNSNSPKNYSFTDKSVTSGKFIYRLKQIDTDGQYEFSKEVEVDLGLPKTFALGQNYPNPFNPTTKINYTLPVDGNVQLQIFTAGGELVKSLVNEKQIAGAYTVEFNAENLASGIYFYKLLVNDFIQIRKMLLMK